MISTDRQDNFVKTCPFGHGFHLPTAQAWRTLKVFHSYQIVLSAAFFGLFVTQTGPSIFGQSNESLFQTVSLIYLALTLFSTVFIRKPYIAYTRQVQFKILADIAFLTLLMHASGGITSGLGILLAVSVAAGGLLAGGQCTLVFAAIATFAVLGEQIYADLAHQFAKTAYTYAGVLSASFFTIGLLALVLAKRVESSEKIALQQRRDIDDLVQLNDYIIKHLQSGIIVVDQHLNIRLANESASNLLGQKTIQGNNLAQISAECCQLFKRWLRSPSEHTTIIAASNETPRTQLSFSQLDSLADNAYIIFLDDLSSVDQMIQQGKLASLGRLTASIAHEIRNPLGAISHAGELLSESTSIEKEDRRLLDIIHKHSGRVNSIVKSVLQLSRQEKNHIEPITLSSWLKEFEQDFKDQLGLEISPLHITTSAKFNEVFFDKNHLKQIIDNLCSNALKYGQANSNKTTIAITTGIHLASQQSYITVTDNGKGIDKLVAQQIFEPFYTTSPSGTGLGLYISSQLAELNHAKLSYEENPSGGSRFTLLFSTAKPTS
ncbi:MAG: two-component sensor histidine kinase [Cycloclasticus sp.]|nr:two-component sensor histidine kinase [Cycloclasticus sp.]MBQ0789006.1 two-component sensor histidine kinase [Cycloclasticus sp.]